MEPLFVSGSSARHFTSTDGVHWDKPDLGVVEVAGRRDHNIIFTSDMVESAVNIRSFTPRVRSQEIL